MAEQIIDGTGSGNRVQIDENNQIHTFSVTETENAQATANGDSYNINTGDIGLTSTTESGVLYFKNNESPLNGESGVSIDAIAIGIDSLGTTSGMSKITVIRNPTEGTLISGASAVDMNQNRNFGSSNTLSSLAYKGAEGNTVTDGDDIAIFYQSAGSRGYYTINLLLPKGSSVAVKIDTQTSSGTTNIYAALVLHRINGKNG